MGAPFRLTPTMASRKALVLKFVEKYIAEWRISPSQAEIAAALGIPRQRVRAIVEKLTDEALLRRTPGSRRGIELPDRIAQAVRLLRAQGVRVADDGIGLFGSLADPVTNSSLPMLPELHHIQEVDFAGGDFGGGGHDQRDDRSDGAERDRGESAARNRGARA